MEQKIKMGAYGFLGRSCYLRHCVLCPGCGETSPSDDGIQPLAADWKGKLFFLFSWS
jgi:hypothetical protein